MSWSVHPRSWGIITKVPLAVAALMILVAVVLSEVVLAHLTETQERHLRDLVQTYLDGLSSAITPSILREDTWEIFDAIERAQELNKGLHPLEAIVTDARGMVIAASDPRRNPVGTIIRVRSDDYDRTGHVHFDADTDTAGASKELGYPGRTIGVIRATFNTRHLAAERHEVVLALVATNGALALVLAAAGWLLVARLLRPVQVLSQHLGQASEGSATLITEKNILQNRGEFNRLFRAYNALVDSMRDREELTKRLAEEERLVSLGFLASTLAHEINNPLGGLFNALATLKKHGHLEQARADTIGLLDRGLISIREVVRTTLALYRTDVASRDLTATDIDDLLLLIGPEAHRKFVTVTLTNRLSSSVALPSTPVRQVALNLLLNAVAATPVGSVVELEVATNQTYFILDIGDRGPGLPPDAADVLAGRRTAAPLRSRTGLGLWTTRRLVDDLGGSINVEWPASGGTILRTKFPLRIYEELANDT